MGAKPGQGRWSLTLKVKENFTTGVITDLGPQVQVGYFHIRAFWKPYIPPRGHQP